MDRLRRKELLQQFKEMKPEMGVYMFKSINTNTIYLGCDKNIKATINGGNKFDLIIGNPPYVKTEDMIKLQDKKEIQAYKSEYYVAYKQFDKYFLFIQRAVDLVKDSGMVCYIVPNKFINNVSGEKIRELISENNYLRLFIDFNYQQVFKDKTIYSSIIMLNKNKEENFEIKVVEVLPYDKDESKVDYSEELKIVLEVCKDRFTEENVEEI